MFECGWSVPSRKVITHSLASGVALWGALWPEQGRHTTHTHRQVGEGGAGAAPLSSKNERGRVWSDASATKHTRLPLLLPRAPTAHPPHAAAPPTSDTGERTRDSGDPQRPRIHAPSQVRSEANSGPPERAAFSLCPASKSRPRPPPARLPASTRPALVLKRAGGPRPTCRRPQFDGVRVRTGARRARPCLRGALQRRGPPLACARGAGFPPRSPATREGLSLASGRRGARPGGAVWGLGRACGHLRTHARTRSRSKPAPSRARPPREPAPRSPVSLPPPLSPQARALSPPPLAG